MSHEVLYDYVETVDPNLTCAICQSALVDPVTTTSCKHTFCRDCITRAISHNPQCPIDRSALNMSSLRDTEQLVKLMLDELKVRCGAEGCGIVLQRGLLLAHLRTCPRAIVTCQDSDCGLSLTRQRLPHHRAYECFQRRMECKKCATILVFRDHIAHAGTGCCDDTDICDLCGEKLGSDSHMHKWKCPLIRIPCPHSHRGCSSIIPRSDLTSHLSTCPFEAFSGFFEMNDARLKALEARTEGLESELDSLRAHLRRIEGNVEVAGRLGQATDANRSSRWNWTAPLVEPMSEAAANVSTPRADVAPLPTSSSPRTPTLSNPSTNTPVASASTAERSPTLNPPAAARPNLAHYHHRSLIAPSFGSHQSYADWAFNRLSGNSGGGWDDVMNRLRGVVVQLAAGLDSMERRNEVRTMTESLRVLEEVNSLRAIVTTMRMQVMMDRPSHPSSLSLQGENPFNRSTEPLANRPVISQTTHATSSQNLDVVSSSPQTQNLNAQTSHEQEDLAEQTFITESVVFSAQGHPPSAHSSTSSLIIANNLIPKRTPLRNSSLNINHSALGVSTIGRSGAGMTGRPVAFPEAMDTEVDLVRGTERETEGQMTTGRSSGGRLSRNTINRLIRRGNNNGNPRL
nr:E3 ubiquitin-protein ligase NRDP1 [Cryptococcus depauperatus CBS 7855]